MISVEKNNLWRKRLLYVLPPVLFCACFPAIDLGATDFMHFEIFLPLIWLVLFDLVSLMGVLNAEMRKMYFSMCSRRSLALLIFPLYISLSVIWTKDLLRGVLTSGVMWAIIVAIISIAQLVRNMRSGKEAAALKNTLLRIFLGAAVGASAICWLQCVLDVMGLSREQTLLCTGCTYNIIGFPHPNGLAAEPQYMGNLLLAPILLVIYMGLFNKSLYSSKKTLVLIVFLTATLFLTLSRGAIFSFGVALGLLMVLALGKRRVKEFFQVIGAVLVAFLVVLGFQGIMAAATPTTDDFYDGVTKSIHQLSLGKIDWRRNVSVGLVSENVASEAMSSKEESGVDIKPGSEAESELEAEPSLEVGSSVVKVTTAETRIPVHFDGYIEDSTNSRLTINDYALQISTKDVGTLWFGVGIGGALRSIVELNGVHEVVPNVYLTILLETGVVGVILLVTSIIVAVWSIMKLKSEDKSILILITVAYMLSVGFFSGVGNVVHIYLIPPIIYIFLRNLQGLSKK